MTAIVLDNAARVKRAMEWLARSMNALNACMSIDELPAEDLEQVAIALGGISQAAHGAWFRRMLEDAGAHQLAAIVDEAAAAGAAAAETAVAGLRRPHAVPERPQAIDFDGDGVAAPRAPAPEFLTRHVPVGDVEDWHPTRGGPPPR